MYMCVCVRVWKWESIYQLLYSGRMWHIVNFKLGFIGFNSKFFLS